MRYVFINSGDPVIKEEEISYLKIAQIVSEEANGDRNIMLDNLVALRKFGWLISRKGGQWVIEHRKN